MVSLKERVEELLTIDGSLCAAMVDSKNGMILASAGSGIDIEISAAGHSDVLRAKNKIESMLGTNDKVQDILITMGKQYHIIRPLDSVEGVFIYLALDLRNANLALARRKVNDFESTINDI